MTRYALIGLGYVAPKHLQAIADTGGELVAACDPHDSVGVLDRYFPNCRYFPEIERFERYLDKQRRAGTPIDTVSICSPSYLHDAHCRLALRNGADAICEKPLVLEPRNLAALEDLERETGRRIHPILQLRHSAELQRRRAQICADTRYDVRLDYKTYRGPWYDQSWKGNRRQSGGLMTNIGIHLFDLLLWMFGPLRDKPTSTDYDGRFAFGELSLERADVYWELGIDGDGIPAGRTSWRKLEVRGLFTDMLQGFTDLHTAAYEAILDGQGLSIQDVRPSLELVARLREG